MSHILVIRWKLDFSWVYKITPFSFLNKVKQQFKHHSEVLPLLPYIDEYDW